MPGRAAPALVQRTRRSATGAGAFAGDQRSVAAGVDTLASRHGRLPATRLGFVVARARRILRLRVAAGALALSRPAARQSSATAAGSGLPLVRRGRYPGKAGKVVRSRGARQNAGRL